MPSLYLANKQSRDMMDEDIRRAKTIFDRTVKNVSSYIRDTNADINPIGITPTNIKGNVGVPSGYDINELSGNVQSLEKTVGELNSMIVAQTTNLQKNPFNADLLDESKNFSDIVLKMDYAPELHKYNMLIDSINSVPLDTAQSVMEDLLPSIDNIINLLSSRFKEWIFDPKTSFVSIGALNRTKTANTTIQESNTYMNKPKDELDARRLADSYYTLLQYYESGKAHSKENALTDTYGIKNYYLGLDARIRKTFVGQTGKGVSDVMAQNMINDFFTRLSLMSNFVIKTLQMTTVYSIIENQIFDKKYIKITGKKYSEYLNTKTYQMYNKIVISEMNNLNIMISLRYPNLSLKSFMYSNDGNQQSIRKEQYEADKPQPPVIPTVEWAQPQGSGKPNRSIRKGTIKDDIKSKSIKLIKPGFTFDQAGNTPFVEDN